jgi:hypothetical protein
VSPDRIKVRPVTIGQQRLSIRPGADPQTASV